MLPCKRLAEGEKSTVTIPQPRPLRAARSNSNSMDGRFGWLNTGLSTSDPAQPPVNLSQITRPPALACALPVLACDAAAILGYFHWRPDRQFHIHRFSISQGLYFFFSSSPVTLHRSFPVVSFVLSISAGIGAERGKDWKGTCVICSTEHLPINSTYTFG